MVAGRGGGKKRVTVPIERVTVILPTGVHDDMVRLIGSERRWFDRQEFIKEAVREKIEREKAKPGRLPPGAERVVRETRVS